jgi:hypothetical protein
MNKSWISWALLVCVTFVLFAASGCSSAIVGTWKTDPVPKDGTGYLLQATFKGDGKFEATTKDGESTAPLKGTYNFDGFKLTLKEAGKPEQTYGATYIMMGSKLDLKQGEKKFTMKKQ